MFAGDQRPKFLAQFVKWFVGRDAFAAQPSVEMPKSLLAAIMRTHGFRTRRDTADEDERKGDLEVF